MTTSRVESEIKSVHDPPLVGAGLTQNGMQRGDDRHSQFAQERQNVAAGRSAENAELVLQADNVDIADVQEIGGAQIGGQVLLLNLEANHFRIIVAAWNVIDGDREAWLWGCAPATAASRSVVNVAMPHLRGKWSPTKAILRTLECFFHEMLSTLSARTMNLSGAEPTK